MKILELFEHKFSKNDQIIKPYIIAEAGLNHEGDISKYRYLL